MVDKKEPAKRPRKATAKPRLEPPGATRNSPVKPDPNAVLLSDDLFKEGLAAVESVSKIGTGHITPPMSRDDLRALIGIEIEGVVADFRAASSEFGARYGRLITTLHLIRDGRPVVLPFGVSAAAAKAAARAAAAAEAAGKSKVQDLLQEIAGLGEAGAFGPEKVTDDKMQRPYHHPPGWLPGPRPPSDALSNHAGRRPRQDIATGAPQRNFRVRLKDAFVRNRRAILSATGYVTVITTLALFALGAGNMATVVGGVSGTAFGIISSLLTYRLLAAVLALYLLLQRMGLTPTREDGIPAPPRDSWLPGLVGLGLVVFAIGPESIAAVVAGVLNTPLNSFPAHAFAAMLGAGLLLVFLGRWDRLLPPGFWPSKPLAPPPPPVFDPPPGFGDFALDPFKEQEAFGTSKMGGGTETRLNEAMQGKRGFFRPKFLS